MVKQTELTHIYNRLNRLNDKLDYNTKILDDILKMLNNNVKKKGHEKNNHIEFVENVYDAVKTSNTLLPSNSKLLEIKNDTNNK